MFPVCRHQAAFLLLFSCFLLSLGLVNARPAIIVRGLDANNQSTTVMTVHTANTVVGAMIETCTITLTPITDSQGQPAVEEVKKCSIQMNANSQDSGSAEGNNTSSALSTSTSSATLSSDSYTSTSTTDASASASSVTASTTTSPNSIASAPPDSPAAVSVIGLTTVSNSAVVASTTSASQNSQTSAVGTTPSLSTPSSAPDSTSSANSSVATLPSAPATVAAAQQASGSAAAASAAFANLGKKISVLPIGLGVFAGISVIALIVVGLVTYERTKYRKAFRQRKLAESGATMGYGGMNQR